MAKKKDEAAPPQPAMAPGGSYAPPVTEAVLDRYEELAAGADRPVKDAMDGLVKMCREFIKTGRSKLRGERHPTGVGLLTKLEPKEVERIDPVVPWAHELFTLGGRNAGEGLGLFDLMPSGTEEYTTVEKIDNPGGGPKERTVVRARVTDKEAWERKNAAMHLLWYAYHLTQDLEPITTDTL